MTICIVFQFTRDAAEYDAFFRRIEQLSENNSRQITDGCILAQVYLTPAAVRRELLPFLRTDDRLFLTPFGKDSCGQLSEKSKIWLKNNVFEHEISEQLPKGFPNSSPK